MSPMIHTFGKVTGKKRRWGFLCNANTHIYATDYPRAIHALEFEGIAYDYDYGERIVECTAKVSGPGINGTQSEFWWGWGDGFLRNFGVTSYYSHYGTIPFEGQKLHTYLFQLESWGSTWTIYRDGGLLASGNNTEDTGANGYNYTIRLFNDFEGIITKYRIRKYYYPFGDPGGRYWYAWEGWKYFDAEDSDISMWTNPGGMVKFAP